jgi:RNA polymerase sigma-70 factor (ECF subfamily)
MELPDAMETDRWVARAAAGDEEAFGQVVQAYYSRVYAAVYQVVRHADDARDLTQAAWVKAWRQLGSYRGDARFYTWIYRIAVNTALDFLRRRKRRPEVSYDAPRPGADEPSTDLDRRDELADPDTPADVAQRREVNEAFARALETLSPEHRAVVVLREVEGMSYDEIAVVLKIRKGTVMSRLFYARRALQQALEPFL